jgi:tetratricopeptide (TPR) repeat protein
MTNTNEFIRAYRVPAMTLLAVACICAALFGLFRLVSYSGPMLAEDFRGAAESSVADPPVVLYDIGLGLYKKGQHAIAKDVFTEAFNQLTKNTGVVPPERKELAGQIQFMLGVVNEHEKQFRVAVTAYEDCLRQTPDNLNAKYNLERLKSQFPDMGKGGGSPQDPSKDPSSGKRNDKKGI